MGLATAWQLSRDEQRVLLLERFELFHQRGASHGATRNANNAYEEKHSLDLFDLAFAQYRELEEASGETLLTLTGLVSHGDQRRVRNTHAALTARGARTELIPAEEAELRWPGMRFEGEALLTHDAGRIQAARVLVSLANEARRNGAELRDRHRVLELDEQPEGVVVSALSPEGGLEYFSAPSAIVTAGAWASQLLGGVVEDMPRLTVTEEHPAHFRVRPQFAEYESKWPSFNHFRPDDAVPPAPVYGMLTPGEGVKVGFHCVGPVIGPDARAFAGTEGRRAELRAYVDEWLPGLDTATAEEISCTYTTSETGRFVLERVGRITIGAGFAGEGFKFVPGVGRVLADAAQGKQDPPAEFRLPQHRSGG